jgi:hypothetical protein
MAKSKTKSKAKAANKIYPPNVIPAAKVVSDALGPNLKGGKKRKKAQKALDDLSSAKPKVVAGGKVGRILSEAQYANIERLLCEIIDT